MDLRSSLGFGFFNRTKAKGRKRSERQLADLYDKVAIRGSIQHVWGDDSPRGLITTKTQSSTQIEPIAKAPKVSMNVGTEAPFVRTDAPTSPTPGDVLDEFGRNLRRQAATPDVAPPLAHYHSILPTPGFSESSVETGMTGGGPIVTESNAPIVPQLVRSMSPSQRSISSLSFEGTIPQHAVHKKFSFCPSTISLVSPRSPNGNVRSPRSLSLTGSNHPYSRRSSVFSSSTPSVQLRRSSAARESLNDEQVAIADEVLDTGLGVRTFQLSPASSLHYTTSIVSRISSTGESVQMEEHPYLPGQIYASPLPDALRGTLSKDGPLDHLAGYGNRGEDDDDTGSDFSGLSEVNAGHSSDSDFHSELGDDDIDVDEQRSGGSTNLRQDPAPVEQQQQQQQQQRQRKRISYTKLESGEYLATVESRRQSGSPPPSSSPFTAPTATRATGTTTTTTAAVAADLRREGSLASHWTIEQEFISSI